MEFLPECATGSIDEANLELVYESADMPLLERDSIRICSNGICETKFIKDVFTENFDVALKKVRFSFKNK